MSSIFEYIKDFGNKSFYEESFNEIDASIMALLSYIDFNDIVSSDKEKIRLEEALEIFLNYSDLKDFLKRGFIQKELIKLCKVIKDKNRYKDIMLYGFVYKISDDSQFGALSMRLPDGKIVVSYEGTDHNLSGWEEDLAFSYKFPVVSHIEAINYLNKYVSFWDREVIIVGHSKGGHLALVASMFAKIFIKWKIKKIYNFDGPGLRRKEFESKKYKSIEKKIYHIIPNYSLFGLLLRHNDKYITIKSNRMGIMAHSIFSWVIEGNEFKKAPLSILSKNLDKSIILWLEQHPDSEREKITTDVFDFLREEGITSFVDVLKIKNIISLIKNSSKLDKETKDMLDNFVKFIIEYHINNIEEVELV